MANTYGSNKILTRVVNKSLSPLWSSCVYFSGRNDLKDANEELCLLDYNRLLNENCLLYNDYLFVYWELLTNEAMSRLNKILFASDIDMSAVLKLIAANTHFLSVEEIWDLKTKNGKLVTYKELAEYISSRQTK